METLKLRIDPNELTIRNYLQLFVQLNERSQIIESKKVFNRARVKAETRKIINEAL